MEKGRCFRCEGLGHITSKCPNKRVMTFTKYHALFEEIKEEGGEKGLYSNKALKEVEEGLYERELLMIRTALSGLAAQEHLEQRKLIFYTRCTVGGKVCSLIVEGGSCANVPSKTMVGKLKLTVTPYPSPYTSNGLIKEGNANLFLVFDLFLH